MKTIFLIISALVLSSLTVVAEEKEEAFQKAFLKAISTGDEALFDLVEFSPDGNPLFDKMTKDSLKEERTKQIKEIQFRQLPEDAIIEFSYEGLHYIPTLPIEKEFIISYESTEEQGQVTATTYRLGTKDGSYKIVATKIKNRPDIEKHHQ